MNRIDVDAVNALRVLAADEVQKANSGHPGLPLGAAPAAYTVWAYEMKHNPKNYRWENRDRYLTGERPLGANMAHSKLVSTWKDSIFGSDAENLIEASIRTKLQAFDAQQWPLKMFHACGTEDMLYQDNRSFSKLAETKAGLEYQYNEYPGGHDFNVWDECSKDFLVWMLK